MIIVAIAIGNEKYVGGHDKYFEKLITADDDYKREANSRIYSRHEKDEHAN